VAWVMYYCCDESTCKPDFLLGGSFVVTLGLVGFGVAGTLAAEGSTMERAGLVGSVGGGEGDGEGRCGW